MFASSIPFSTFRVLATKLIIFSVGLAVRHAQAARAQAPHDLGRAGLRTWQAAADGGAAIRALAKAAIAAVGKGWRAHTIRRARVAAVRELHALDNRTLRDIG